MAEHDPSYKLLFSHRDLVADLIRGFVHEDWVEQLDFTTLQRVSEIAVSHDLRERDDDMIWRLRRGERWVYVYLLLEFQSSVDRLMAVRLLTYVGLLYQDLAAGEIPSGSPLPPVLPIVLFKWREILVGQDQSRRLDRAGPTRAVAPMAAADPLSAARLSSGLPIPSWRDSAMSPRPCFGSRAVAGPRISSGSWRV